MNGWLEYEFPLGLCLFSGAMFVSGRVVGSERTSLPVASRFLTSLIEVITPVTTLVTTTASEVMKWLRHNRLFKILVFPRFCQEVLSLPTTLPETNIAPENRLSPKETNIPPIHFQGRTVSFMECTR